MITHDVVDVWGDRMTADPRATEVARLADRVRNGRFGWQRLGAARKLGELATPAACGELARAAIHASDDERLVATAEAAFGRLTDQASVDALCATWWPTRNRWLGQVIIDNRMLPAEPAELRDVTAMHVGDMAVVAAAGPRSVASLVRLSEGARDPARIAALGALQRPDAREELCRLAVDGGNQVALDAVLAGGLRPADPKRRAVVLFLAGEFDRFAELDVDGALWRAAQQRCPERTRLRLLEQARRSGRVEWVLGLSEPDEEALTPADWDQATTILSAAQRWDDLWQLALRATPLRAVDVLRTLVERGWRPVAHLSGPVSSCGLAPPAGGVFDDPPVTVDARIEQPLIVSPDGRLLASPAPRYGIGKAIAITNVAAAVRDHRSFGYGYDPRYSPHHVTGDIRPTSLVATPDGGSIVVVGLRGVAEGGIEVRRWRHGELVGSAAVERRVEAVAVLPDSSRLAVLSNGVISLRTLPDLTVTAATDPPDPELTCMDVSSDGSTVIGVGGSTISWWSVPGLILLRRGQLDPRPRQVTAVIATAPDACRFVTTDDDGVVRSWSLRPGAAGDPRPDPGSFVIGEGMTLAASSDGGTLALAGAGQTVRIRRSSDLAELEPLRAGYVVPQRPRFTGGFLAATSAMAKALVWRSALWTLCETPIPAIDRAEIARLRDAADGDPSQLAWLRMVDELVGWQHRHDIEIDPAGDPGDPGGAPVPGAATDIEITEG